MHVTHITPKEFDTLVQLVFKDVVQAKNFDESFYGAIYDWIVADLKNRPLPVNNLNDGTKRVFVDLPELGVSKLYDFK